MARRIINPDAILYGDTLPRRGLLPADGIAASCMNDGWFENYGGWSGSARWMAKVTELPKAWISTYKNQQMLNSESIEKILAVEVEGTTVDNALACTLSKVNSDYVRINAGGVKADGDVVSVASMETIETLTEPGHHWYVAAKEYRVLYIADGQLLGLVTTGYLS